MQAVWALMTPLHRFQFTLANGCLGSTGKWLPRIHLQCEVCCFEHQWQLLRCKVRQEGVRPPVMVVVCC